MDRLDLSAKREDMVIMAPKGPPRNRNRRLLGAGTRTSLLWDPAMGALWRANATHPATAQNNTSSGPIIEPAGQQANQAPGTTKHKQTWEPTLGVWSLLLKVSSTRRTLPCLDSRSKFLLTLYLRYCQATPASHSKFAFPAASSRRSARPWGKARLRSPFEIRKPSNQSRPSACPSQQQLGRCPASSCDFPLVARRFLTGRLLSLSTSSPLPASIAADGPPSTPSAPPAAFVETCSPPQRTSRPPE